MAGRLAFSHAQKAQAASAYRNLIRSSKFTFDSDPQTYRQFLVRAKELFSTKVLNPTYLLTSHADPKVAASASNVPEEVVMRERFEDELRGVLELSKYLTRNIVQGKHSEDGRRLVLRFTDKTEVGDNSTIKNPGSTAACLPTSGCCGGSHDSPSTTPDPPPSRLSQAALERREKRRLNRLQQSSSS
ncbi:uncharacterized protein PGTG_14331 [Puccinia graminis f. sp. tritici CRL 75-36-700-3]|uniref:Mitochondrial zinc maintenance protein 1, mitochondrial n=1 Tax=Puccinia graminis f. sp. tritici (strain CRL 75-36-700-3 / race SCCL) TaxID=418459 RepID=E3KVF2_PUCGT|nr:uncharacterized protein PGTG_14331 [Puccinia graminis f. sp. tritici CRL 75-36-700-3]EFP88247.2 hypothetical protein PGTG_14331 [Puccinia graminis f. sp. tritici CRL 75-36-700-3]